MAIFGFLGHKEIPATGIYGVSDRIRHLPVLGWFIRPIMDLPGKIIKGVTGGYNWLIYIPITGILGYIIYKWSKK